MGKAIDDFVAAMERQPPVWGGAKPENFEVLIALAVLELIEGQKEILERLLYAPFPGRTRLTRVEHVHPPEHED